MADENIPGWLQAALATGGSVVGAILTWIISRRQQITAEKGRATDDFVAHRKVEHEFIGQVMTQLKEAHSAHSESVDTQLELLQRLEAQSLQLSKQAQEIGEQAAKIAELEMLIRPSRKAAAVNNGEKL